MSIVNAPLDTHAYYKYRIGKINIHLDYDPLVFMKGRDSSYIDTTYGTYGITYREKLKIRPRLISETVQFKSGELYNVQKVVDSYSRLQALNLFKFINIVFRGSGRRYGRESTALRYSADPYETAILQCISGRHPQFRQHRSRREFHIQSPESFPER